MMTTMVKISRFNMNIYMTKGGEIPEVTGVLLLNQHVNDAHTLPTRVFNSY